MDIKEISIEKIVPYWNNPRNNLNTIEPLKKSISLFGFNVPLVLDKKNVVIAGHARLSAAKQLGFKTVPCLIVDLNEDQAKQYRIADNKIHEKTFWEDEQLFKELREISDRNSLLDLGFSTAELNKIFFDNKEDLEILASTIRERRGTSSTESTKGEEEEESAPSILGSEEDRECSFDDILKERTENYLELQKEKAIKDNENIGYESSSNHLVIQCPFCGETINFKDKRFNSLLIEIAKNLKEI